MNDITKLPKWAQARIQLLETEYYNLSRTVEEMLAEAEESHVYTTDIIRVYGKMRSVRNYLPVKEYKPVTITDGHGLDVRVSLLDPRGVSITYSCDPSLDIGVYPKSSNQFEIR
jgi:hypothetical protein